MGSLKKTALGTSTNTAYHDRLTPMQAYYAASAIPNSQVLFMPSASPAMVPDPNIWGGQHLISPSGTLIQYPTTIYPHGPNVNNKLTREQRAAPLSSSTEEISKGKGQFAPPVSALTERKVSNGSNGQRSAKKCKRSSDNPSIVRESGESGLVVPDLGNDSMSESEETECDTLSNRSDEDTSQDEFDTSLHTSNVDTCDESDEDTSDEDAECEDLDTKVVKKKRILHSLTLKLKNLSEECEDISEDNRLIKEKLINFLGKERVLKFEKLESEFLDTCNGDSKNKGGDRSRGSDSSLSERENLLCNEDIEDLKQI